MNKTLLSCGKVCYWEFFKQCTQLEIDLDDMLPRSLCNSCSNDLAAAYMFVQTALQAHEKLQREFLSKELVMTVNNDNSVPDELLQYVDNPTDENNMLLECVALDDDNDNEVEDVEQVEEQMVTMYEEQHIMELTASEIEYNTVINEIKCEPKIEPPSPSTELDYYAEDELDNDYLLEYNEEEENNNHKKNNYIKLEENTDSDMDIEKNNSKCCPYACDKCRCAFRCRNTPAKHKLARHVNVKKFENTTDDSDSKARICTHCSMEFPTAAEEDEQVQLLHAPGLECQEHHNNNNNNEAVVSIKQTDCVECPICKKQLQRKNLDKHLLLHKNKANLKDNKFLCAYCPRELKNQKSLAQHERIHASVSSDVVYICEECNRHYATQFLLDAHRKQAHKARDHVCSICGNAFKLKNQLVNHMKLHLEKNIKCPHCDKRYARPFDLNVHLRSHTGELPFSCHLCDRRFAIKVRLTYHLQKHYGTKHPCRECGAEFNSKQKLKAHSYKHTGMPYRCEMCHNRGFANRDV